MKSTNLSPKHAPVYDFIKNGVSLYEDILLTDIDCLRLLKGKLPEELNFVEIDGVKFILKKNIIKYIDKKKQIWFNLVRALQIRTDGGAL